MGYVPWVLFRTSYVSHCNVSDNISPLNPTETSSSFVTSTVIMSWLSQMSGGEAPPPYREAPSEKMVNDPSIPNRKVAAKSANRPFLA